MSRLSAFGIFSLFEGVAIALESFASNRVRAALTILGVAVGVFVVVVISAAIHGINESVAKDFESAGPTTFFVSRYPITFEACDGTDDTCKWRHNPRLTLSRTTRRSTRCPTVRAAGAQLQMSKEVRYKDRALSEHAGHRLHGELDDRRRRRRSLSRPQLHRGRGDERRARRRSSTTRWRRSCSATPIHSTRTSRSAASPFTVIGIYHYSGELPLRRQQPARDRPVRDGASASLQRVVQRRRHLHRAARRRDARPGAGRGHRADARAPRACARLRTTISRSSRRTSCSRRTTRSSACSSS